MQALVIGGVLVGAGVAKIARPNASPAAALESLALGRLLKRVLGSASWGAVGLLETAVGLAVLLWPAQVWPEAVAAFLLLAAGVFAARSLQQSPGQPCGCFGALSISPVSLTTVGRAFGLALVAAMGSLAQASWQASLAPSVWALAAAEVLAITFPEIREFLERQKDSSIDQAQDAEVPRCLYARVPWKRTIAALAASEDWALNRSMLASEEIVDHWREGCWRFVSYEARSGMMVFAVRVHPPQEGPRIKVALVPEERTLVGAQPSAS